MPSPDALMLSILRICQTLIRHDGRDLTARQLAGFLLVYTNDTPQRVNGLAEQMNLPLSAMRCVMDRLARLDLITCAKDAQDRRCTVAYRTVAGKTFLGLLTSLEKQAAAMERKRLKGRPRYAMSRRSNQGHDG